MQFMIKALDGKGKLAKRMEVRPRHLDAYLASEPYVVENVWEKVEIETMNVVIGGKKP